MLTVSVTGNEILIDFDKKTAANSFAKLEFFSRLLHSLNIGEDEIWRESERLDVEIKGFPKNIKWVRLSEVSFKGVLTSTDNFHPEQYSTLIKSVVESYVKGEKTNTGAKIYKFSIGRDDDWTEYGFYMKSRTIAALCVLYDLEPHSRNDLEINIPKNLSEKKWPVEESHDLQRTYGDPSKTADELRNEGWSRMGDNATMQVYRQTIGGQVRQMYKLTSIEQSLDLQVKRSVISKAWRDALYASQNNTCQICLHQYSEELLEPDHRVPVIYEADGLNDENFLDKLMTLCRFCNQQKRETTKRLPHDYDWHNSPWAYPEKFDIEIAKLKIQRHMQQTGETLDQVIEQIADQD